MPDGCEGVATTSAHPPERWTRLRRPGMGRPIGVPVSDGLRVLIVEDVAAAAEFAARRLVLGGIPCMHIQVATEKDLRTALRSLPPHLILSDLVLAELDG